MIARFGSTAVLLAVVFLIFLLMWLGWRARRRRQKSMASVPPVPSTLGPMLLATKALYVATTLAGAPLERVVVAGLGHRARARVAVHASGVLLGLAGAPDVFIAARRLRGVGRATFTIDRVVERGGLVVITWVLGGTEVDSYLRVTGTPGAPELIEAIQRLRHETGSEAA